MSSLGDRTRELRLAHGLTQRELADLAETSWALVNALESGTRKYILVSDIVKLAASLKVEMSVLWEAVPNGATSGDYVDLSEPDRAWWEAHSSK